MFVPLQISISEIGELRLNNPYRRSMSLYPAITDLSNDFYNRILSEVTENGIIDGSNLSKLVFPFDREQYDVFISYSHNDEDDAEYLYHYLQSQGLNCFLDSTIWHSADNLLRKIDNKYCLNKDGKHYDYRKRNFSTSHVHAMLSMAMLEAINRSECCIFLKSNNSVTLEDGIENQTLSPWIYEEITYAKMCKITLPERFRLRKIKMFSDGGPVGLLESVSDNLRIAYNIDLKDFQEITHKDLFYGSHTKILDSIYRRYNIFTQNLRD